MKTPDILFIVFKREESTNLVFQAIRKAKPARLFIAADGPRNDKEKEMCHKVRSLFNNIDWDCQVFKKFRDENVGIKRNISEAVSWFLEEVTEGIILEDDCLPSEDFFHFTNQLLELYRHDTRIYQISGSSFMPKPRGSFSYFFSRYNHGWGWATWKRAWDQCDLEMDSLDEFLEVADRTKFWENRRERKYWTRFFQEQRSGLIDTWDYQWKFTLWKNNGLCLYPNFNMIKNLGFNSGATNTVQADSEKAERPFQSSILDSDGRYINPCCILRDRKADLWTFNHLYWGSFFNRLIHKFDKFRKLLLKRKKISIT